MNYEYEIKQLKAQLQNLQEIVLRMSRSNTKEVSAREQTTAQVDSLTPYRDTKTAYIGDTTLVFTDVPNGNMIIYSPVEFTYERLADKVVVGFDKPLEEVTEITISIS